MDADTASKLEAIRKLWSTNQQLEKERTDVLCTPSIEPVYEKLLLATANVHVGWLLSFPGSKVCQLLSLLLDSEKPGWEEFAFRLGLTPEVIRDIKSNRNLDEGPTHTVVWIYAQKRDVTVSKLLEVLYHMKRYDALQKLHDFATGERDPSKNISQYASGNTIKRPPNKYILFDTCETVKHKKLSEAREEANVENEVLVSRDVNNSSENTVIAEKSTKKPRYRAIVMLTFGEDGLECAKRVAAALRKEIIGVLILDEHRERLLSNPELFITEFFQQIDYVFPIITKGYLNSLTSFSLRPEPLTVCADARYVKLIYTLMANQYLQNGCINANVRCILPDGHESLMQEHPVARNRPVLQAWLPEREIDVLANAVLTSVGTISEE